MLKVIFKAAAAVGALLFLGIGLVVWCVAQAPDVEAAAPSPSLTTPAMDSVEVVFTAGHDGGVNLDAGHRGWLPDAVPCGGGVTKVIHVLVPSGCDGGVGFGGSHADITTTPVVRGPGQDYTAVRNTLYAAPPIGFRCAGIKSMCGR